LNAKSPTTDYVFLFYSFNLYFYYFFFLKYYRNKKITLAALLPILDNLLAFTTLAIVRMAGRLLFAAK
jgi:hypothetical protein